MALQKMDSLNGESILIDVWGTDNFTSQSFYWKCPC